ncbi:hypothetical protein BTH160X_60475 [Brochothrix thermosphacta]|nr:hypothetical protein BTH160X_60475 [Brochothrix thermosphacta]
MNKNVAAYIKIPTIIQISPYLESFVFEKRLMIISKSPKTPTVIERKTIIGPIILAIIVSNSF